MPGPLKPLIAIPTTAGTGSETTGVSIFDLHGCTPRPASPAAGSSRRSACSIPTTPGRMPPAVAASSGLDILSHAVESFTALPFTDRAARPSAPALRPAYQGANPISDVWSLQALRIVTAYLVRAVEDPADDEARAQMMLAASYAGIGFGNAGVHLPHGMSYPVSGHVKQLPRAGLRRRSCARAARHVGDPQRPGGVPLHRAGEPDAAPRRPPKRSAPTIARAAPSDAGQVLADRITWFMQRLRVPNGLRAVGYSSADIPGARRGHAAAAPRDEALAPARGSDDLARLFEDAMVAW